MSQILSAWRLQQFFLAANSRLKFRSQLELYFVGMFYNFFIPGGIGGDAYKVFLLKKNFGWKAKRLTTILFCDRLSGLIAICILICALGFSTLTKLQFPFLALIIAGILGGFFLFKKLFSAFSKVYWKAVLYSVGVQILQVGSFIFLLKSIGVGSGFAPYALLFLASSVLSLVSFAGIGVREMLFLQAAKYFDFSPQTSISASLLFTVTTAFFSLLGVFFQIRRVNLELSTQDGFH